MGKRIFLDCPRKVDGLTFAEPRRAENDRVVAASDFFGATPPKNAILAAHSCWHAPVETKVEPILLLARVAGYRKAVYGIPDENHPVLFLHPDNPDMLISTIPISSFAERRYAPNGDWESVVAKIADWLEEEEVEDAEREEIRNPKTEIRKEKRSGDNLTSNAEHPTLNLESGNHSQTVTAAASSLAGIEFECETAFTAEESILLRSLANAEMSVRPAFSPDTPLPKDVEKTAFNANADWFEDNIFYTQGETIAVSEGYASEINHKGRQSARPSTRCDCTGEASMVPALRWALSREYPSRDTAGRIMDCLFNGGKLRDDNPASPMYGGLYFYEHLPVFYSDDNCRAAMGCVLSSELTGNFDFAEDILRTFLTMLRSTGKLGFRRRRLDMPGSFENGETWKTYADEEHVEYQPHYHAFAWAGMLQAYALTGHREFRDKAENAIRMTMENAFPDKLKWTNGITQEYARMILPLAMLVELEDTREHRGWLKSAADTLLENMVECGTIREKMGDLNYGQYPSPRTNEEYGSTEAALIQENGDPACDLVYTVNYAFIGLHEASMATGEAYYIDAENKLADFLCRIQARSTSQLYLDGCWLRGFDYELWDYYGSSADNGWGAWCVESGWTNSWIAATFGLRQLNRPLLCMESATEYRKIFPEIFKEMSILCESRNDPSAKHTKTVAPGAE